MERTNEINLESFIDMIQKSSFNLALDFIRINFKDGRMKSKMLTASKDVISIIDKPNNLIELSEHDEITFNIGDLDKLLHTAETMSKGNQLLVNAKIHDDIDKPKIILMPTHQYKGATKTQKHECSMVHPDVVDLFIVQQDPLALDYFITFPIDDEIFPLWNLLKIYGARYNKVYVRVKDNKLSFDSTEVSNSYENTHDMPLCNTDKDIDDVIICFHYKSFVHLLNICQMEYSKPDRQQMFCSIAWLDELDTGFMYVYTEDKSEQYYILNSPV